MAKRAVMLALFMSLFAPALSGAMHQERYHEDLAIRPLSDGKVVTAFTFTTLLGAASPRDPRDSESSGAPASLVLAHHLTVDMHPKPSITPFFHSLSAKSYASMQ